MENTSKPKIIIADDEPTILSYLRVLLEKEYDLISAKNGKELVEKTLQHDPDLIITDIIMPILSGYRAIQRLKEKLSLKNIPVIFFSSSLKDLDIYDTYKPEKVRSCLLFKPLSKKEILNRVKEFINIEDAT
jgi:CheY-like chemotaxis protein